MLSIVIPTLQKNKIVLENLVKTLSQDSVVDEIIIIDNSLKGLDFNYPKLKTIIPSENLFVNKSWNLGVKEAKNEIIGLLNDDILISENFCSQVFSKINKNMGIIGFNSEDFMIVKQDITNEKPQNSEISLEPIQYMDRYFGVAMFFNKKSYKNIPEDIKIVYGDCWLIHHNNKQKRVNYRINGQKIFHIGSLSSGSKSLSEICENDAKLYKKYTLSWFERMFSFEEHRDCYKLRLLGVTTKFKKKK